MAHVEKVVVGGNLVKRVQKTELDFQPGVNLLIGPNGCGKSTILNILNQRTSNSECHVTIDGRLETYAFDFEKDNPRTISRLSQISNAKFNLQVKSRFQSHGENVRMLLRMMKGKDAEGCLFILDEPEMALDVRGLLELRKILTETTAAQVILVTHSPLLILSGYHTVEMVDGYCEEVRKVMTDLVK